jgi:hypothetical protein
VKTFSELQRLAVKEGFFRSSEFRASNSNSKGRRKENKKIELFTE